MKTIPPDSPIWQQARELLSQQDKWHAAIQESLQFDDFRSTVARIQRVLSRSPRTILHQTLSLCPADNSCLTQLLGLADNASVLEAGPVTNNNEPLPLHNQEAKTPRISSDTYTLIEAMSKATDSERKRQEVEHVFEALIERRHFEAAGRLLDQLPLGEKLGNILHPKRGTVLHIALEYKAPDALTHRIMDLIDMEWCCKQRNYQGESLLHKICSANFSRITSAKIILKKAPELIHAGDNPGFTPFHHVTACLFFCVGDSRTPMIKLLCNQPGAQEALVMQSGQGDTPLHFAFQNVDMVDEPEVLEVLSEGCPSALQLQDRNGWTPLHRACKASPADVLVIQRLITLIKREALEEVLVMPDNEGLTPLATCCRVQRHNLGIIEVVYEAAPDALATPDLSGRLPIHHAVRCQNWYQYYHDANGATTISTIEFLVSRGGLDILGTQDSNGQTPLHTVCSTVRNQSPSFLRNVIQFLVELYPDALEIRDSNEDRPIDVFRQNCRHMQCGQDQDKDLLIAEAAMALMAFLPDTPLLLHSCLHHPECSPKLARFFVVAFQDELSTVDANGDLPIHIVASTPLSATGDSKFHHETLKLMLRSHPDACKVPNGQGDLPLTLMARAGKSWDSGSEPRPSL